METFILVMLFTVSSCRLRVRLTVGSEPSLGSWWSQGLLIVKMRKINRDEKFKVARSSRIEFCQHDPD